MQTKVITSTIPTKQQSFKTTKLVVRPTKATTKPATQNEVSISVGILETTKPTKQRTTTSKPSEISTNTVIKLSKKPVVFKNVTLNRKTTVALRRNVTHVTKKPNLTSTTLLTPSVAITASYVETTKTSVPDLEPTGICGFYVNYITIYHFI